jgi:hypothetical protein
VSVNSASLLPNGACPSPLLGRRLVLISDRRAIYCGVKEEATCTCYPLSNDCAAKFSELTLHIGHEKYLIIFISYQNKRGLKD